MEIFNPSQIRPSISNQIQEKAEGLADKIGTGASKGDDLQSAAQDFESIFLHKMLEAMRKTVPKSGLLESFSSDMYQSMFDEELANEMSKKGDFGLAKMMYRQLGESNPENPSSNSHSKKIVDIKLGE